MTPKEENQALAPIMKHEMRKKQHTSAQMTDSVKVSVMTAGPQQSLFCFLGPNVPGQGYLLVISLSKDLYRVPACSW